LKIYKFFTFTLLILALLIPSSLTFGQSENSEYPVYIVQTGDTINVISIKFNVSADDIISVNGITDANLLSVGTRLLIPGIEGISGVLTYNAVSIGEYPDSLSREYQIPKEVIFRLNRTTSPSEFYIGSNVILVETPTNPLNKLSINNTQSILDLSIKNNLSPWEVTNTNLVSSPWELLPGDSIYASSDEEEALEIENDIDFVGLPLTQGYSAVINIKSDTKPTKGNIGNSNLNFFNNDPYFSSLFGIHAMQEPGLYPFHLEYQNDDGQNVVIDQLVLIQKGFFPQDPPLQVDPSTLDEAIGKPEDDLIFKTTEPFTDEKYWSGVFEYPVDEPICIRSWFGNRRSYNDQPYNRFHTGVDFGVCANLNVYAPANGIVVFADSLLVRGNSTIIDHGLGVYSGFWHQEEIFVEVGQSVSAGDLIGEIGSTGRSTGPHLHWELIVNVTQVDALPWTDTIYP
jgi:murein DD-endopeptidase MepM/ murein hydrolase activator NlpD